MDELRRLNATSDSLDEPLAYPLGRTATRPPRPTASPDARRVDLVVSVILTVVQAAAGGLLTVLNTFLGFAFGACGDPAVTCNFGLGYAATFIVPVLAVIVLLATIILIVRNRARSRLGWWIPLAGIAATVIALLIATAFTNVAVGGAPL